MDAFKNLIKAINSNSVYPSDDVGYVIFMNVCMSFRKHFQQNFGKE